MSHFFLKKTIQQLLASTSDSNETEGKENSNLKRTLGAFSITMLGVGAIIGAGIFSLTGTAAALHSGPGIVYSFILGGFLCAMAGLCYAEMAAMIPVSGSAYAYAYTTMGEGMAWIIGWALVLEYAFGASVVANSWSGYLLSLIQKTLHQSVSDTILCFTKGPWDIVTLSTGQQVYGIWNVPASFIALVVMCVLYRGITKSSKFNTVVVILKMTIVILFILLGIGVISWTNLNANPDAIGLAKLVPAREVIVDAAGKQFTRYGWLNGGVLSGAGTVFFAYIGLDAVSTVAQESKNPKRDMPIGILASLAICTFLYVLVGITLTGVVNYRQLNISDPIALGIDQIIHLRNWPAPAHTAFTFIIKLGALSGLTSVVLVFTMGQTRIFYAIAKDGLLPWFNKLHPNLQTPHIATIFTGIFISICSGLFPMSVIGELVSLGTLLIFLIVCISVAVLRYTSPNIERPFNVPMFWFVCPTGILSCIWIMSGINIETWIRLTIWLGIGLSIYFIYGRRHSVSQIKNGHTFGPLWIDYVGVVIFLIGSSLLIRFIHNIFTCNHEHFSLFTGSGMTAIIGVSMLVYAFRLLTDNIVKR